MKHFFSAKREQLPAVGKPPTFEAVIDKENQELAQSAEEVSGSSRKEREWNSRRRLKRATLNAISILAFFGGTAGIEARAQNRIVPQEDGSVKIESVGESDPAKVEANKKKTEKLRRLVEDVKFQQKIVRLRSVYGEAINPLIFEIVADEWDLKELETASGERRNFLLTELAGRYDLFWSKKEILKRAEKRPKTPKISGFELAEYSNEKVKSILQEFPPELIENIDEVVYVPEEERVTAPPASGAKDAGADAKEEIIYNVAGRAKNVGIQSVVWHGPGYAVGNVLKVYKTKDIRNENELRRIIAHELAHFHDWSTSNRLTTKERIEMLDEFTKYAFGSKRPKFHYTDGLVPEEYKKKGWDEKAMKYRQATELWAEEFESFGGGFTVAQYKKLKRNILEGGLATVMPGIVMVDDWLNRMEIPAYRGVSNAFSNSPRRSEK